MFESKIFFFFFFKVVRGDPYDLIFFFLLKVVRGDPYDFFSFFFSYGLEFRFTFLKNEK
jgi:hypothetical protein